MIVDLLIIKTRIIWPDAAHIKESAEILREHSQTQDHIKRLPNATISGDILSFQEPGVSLKDNYENKIVIIRIINFI
jgi:hypothetical protein